MCLFVLSGHTLQELGRAMTDDDFKRIREAGKVPAKQYTDRTGKRRCVGTKDLKATQCCS